jgi:hypothetical protein
MKRIALSWRVPVPAVMLVLLGCSADLTLPGSTAPGVAVAVLEGDGQVGTVGQELPDPVVVQVKTDAGQAIPDRRVAFVAAQGAGAGAGFDPDTAVTDAQGQARTRWVLGTAVGVYTAEARLVPDGESALPTASLQATADPGDPDTVRAVGPTVQPGHRGEALPEALAVLTVDRFGNPVAGAEVKWEASSGNGALSAETTLTGSDGTTSVIWTLGNRVGVQRATAKVEHASGSPVTFMATVLF